MKEQMRVNCFNKNMAGTQMVPALFVYKEE